MFSIKKIVFLVFILIAAYLLAVVFFAPATEIEISSEAELKAKELFKYNCIMCHGDSGAGTGATAGALPVSPPDWTNPDWQRSVTDDGIRMAIVGGGRAIGRSDFMPPHPQLAGSEELQALVKMVREFDKNN